MSHLRLKKWLLVLPSSHRCIVFDPAPAPAGAVSFPGPYVRNLWDWVFVKRPIPHL